MTEKTLEEQAEEHVLRLVAEKEVEMRAAFEADVAKRVAAGQDKQAAINVTLFEVIVVQQVTLEVLAERIAPLLARTAAEDAAAQRIAAMVAQLRGKK